MNFSNCTDTNMVIFGAFKNGAGVFLLTFLNIVSYKKAKSMKNNRKAMIPILRLHALPGVGAMGARKILTHYGSAEAFFGAPKAQAEGFLPRKEPAEKYSPTSSTAHRVPLDYLHPKYQETAEKEYEFIEAHKIKVQYFENSDYPFYLRQALDAPILLFGKGHLELENRKIIAVVGTRNMTAQGGDFCKNFIEEIAPLDPVIVSGFALGVDICVQMAAVAKGLKTVACLAHGFKHIYPAVHRTHIKAVMERGGFHTEFLSDTHALSGNFVSRNRIIAGLSQATLVVESAKKGGALYTAQLAESYNRSVFAVPGRPTDQFSVGCNDLIKHLKAQMITRARDLILAMNWETHPNLALNLGGEIGIDPPPPIYNEALYAAALKGDLKDTPSLNTEEKVLYEVLFKQGALHADVLAVILQWQIKKLLPCLMTLEIKGMVRSLPGQVYEAI